MQNNNNHYWANASDRAQKAKQWAEKMRKEHLSEIAHSVRHSLIRNEENTGYPRLRRYSDTIIRLESLDSVSAVLKYTDQSSKTAVLNFASYKEPGGMFLQGSKAQEECLCHESTLYNVLREFDSTYYARNRKALNKALYQNVALYSPDVYFERGESFVKCDVITCAAPNFTIASSIYGVSREENTAVLKSRIKFILHVAAAQQVDTLILGAFGAGVFGQDAKEVAEITMELLKYYNGVFKKVVFAVIDEKSANYQAFNDMIWMTRIGAIKSVKELFDEITPDEITPDDITGTLGQLLDKVELPPDLHDQVLDLYTRAVKLL